jgi:hypothetical protein
MIINYEDDEKKKKENRGQSVRVSGPDSKISLTPTWMEWRPWHPISLA